MPIGLLLKTIVLVSALICFISMAKTLRKIWRMDRAGERAGNPPTVLLVAGRFLISEASHLGKFFSRNEVLQGSLLPP